MASRGPDGSGVWASGPVALGHRRLAIIDLSSRGDQPMVDPELGLSVVFNGCIYNHRQLRRELESHGYRFFSTSDTEGSCKAVPTTGARTFVDHLIGMFAFCIVERDTGRAMLARDRLGVKPLYLSERSRPPPLRLQRCRRSWPAAVSTQRSTRSGCTTTSRLHAIVPGPTHDPERRPEAATGHAAGRRARRSPDGQRPTGPPCRLAGANRSGRRRSGPRRSTTRCASRSSGGSWPTCRSACCSPAASTRA